MNVFTNWTKDRSLGILLGIATPIVLLPLTIYLWATYQGYTFDFMWREFLYFYNPRIKILTLSIIPNLIWFYRFLNKERWEVARGIIIGSFAFAPYIIYIKFFG